MLKGGAVQQINVKYSELNLNLDLSWKPVPPPPRLSNTFQERSQHLVRFEQEVTVKT